MTVTKHISVINCDSQIVRWQNCGMEIRYVKNSGWGMYNPKFGLRITAAEDSVITVNCSVIQVDDEGRALTGGPEVDLPIGLYNLQALKELIDAVLSDPDR